MTSIPPMRPTLLFRIGDARDRSNSQHPVGTGQGGVAVDLVIWTAGWLILGASIDMSCRISTDLTFTRLE